MKLPNTTEIQTLIFMNQVQVVIIHCLDIFVNSLALNISVNASPVGYHDSLFSGHMLIFLGTE